MESQSIIERIADLRYEEASCLLKNEMWDGAYYLAGYSIELLLKARICKNLQIDNFFEFELPVRKDFYRVFKSHNIRELLFLTGMFEDLMNSTIDEILVEHWSMILGWNEDSRYKIDKTKEDATSFFISVKTIGLWIKGKL